MTKDALRMAGRFILEQGRPLEAARFRHEFEGGPADDVVGALRAFKNPDGGFGHALEPDLRTPDSSVLCTSLAFQVLRELDVPADHELVSGGLDYLAAQLDEDLLSWRMIPVSAEKYPHAPWWNQAGREAQLDSWSLNPTAEILGYLYDYPRRITDEILQRISERVLTAIDALKEIEMHDLLCCLRLLKAIPLTAEFRSRLQDRLSTLIEGSVCCDPAQWEGYCLRPLQVVDSPQSPFYVGLEAAVEANLDYEIGTQNADGSWTPAWSWGDQYPEEWPKAQREWSGMITLEKLLTLKRFGRIEAGAINGK